MLFWCFSIPALLLALASLRGWRGRAAYVSARLAERFEDLPPASVIVPVKGEDRGLRENLAALASLDYPDYELIVTARSAADIPPGVLPRRARIVLAGEGDPDTGEKVWNLRAAVRAARRRSDVLAFADSDGLAPQGWLRALAGPLAEPGVGAVTGYRWHTPDPARFWGLVQSVWDAAIAGTLGPGASRFAWGGATAIRKETFFAARVTESWIGAVSDDYALSAAVRAAGLRIVYAPGATVATHGGAGMREFSGWARRQLLLTRFHDPGLWWPALLAHVVYCAGMVAATAAALGVSRIAVLVLALQIAPGMFKGAARARLARKCLPGSDAWFRRNGWAHFWLVPVATWIWLAVLVSSAFGATIRWRGVQYELKHAPRR